VTLLGLLLPALASVAFARSADRIVGVDPRRSVWRLAVGGSILAVAAVASAAIAAWVLVARIPLIASIGGWDVRRVQGSVDVPVFVSIVGLVVLVVAGARLFAASSRAMCGWRAVLGLHRSLRPGPRIIDASVVAGAAVAVPALPGHPGRIVLDSALLDALEPAERTAVIAHETEHLDARHAWASTVVALAVAANPLLRSLGPVHALAVERAADEQAAARTDRRTTARAVAMAALHASTTQRLILGIGSSVTAIRVEALLAEPTGGRGRPALFFALPFLAALGALAAGVRMETVFEALMRVTGSA
jgi:beta-lactamase regulating signal transducer with metallopeptidase domain